MLRPYAVFHTHLLAEMLGTARVIRSRKRARVGPNDSTRKCKLLSPLGGSQSGMRTNHQKLQRAPPLRGWAVSYARSLTISDAAVASVYANAE